MPCLALPTSAPSLQGNIYTSLCQANPICLYKSKCKERTQSKLPSPSLSLSTMLAESVAHLKLLLCTVVVSRSPQGLCLSLSLSLSLSQAALFCQGSVFLPNSPVFILPAAWLMCSWITATACVHAPLQSFQQTTPEQVRLSELELLDM